MLLRQLEYIVAVEKLRNFTKAADECCVTQPTLSAQIKSLENYLGIKIFDRSQHPVLPTEQGKLILEQAKGIVNQYRDLVVFSKKISQSRFLGQ